jgi:anti-anti-sigma factor
VFSELQDGYETFPGVIILRLDGALFFATAEALEERVRELLDEGGRQRELVLDMKAVNFVDAQGAAKLGELEQLLQARGVALRLAGVHPQVRTVLDADGITERVRVDGNVRTAVTAGSSAIVPHG